MTYVPKPIDTANVALDPDIVELLEKLARNAHDIWARQRIADGWKHGRHRDDKAKEHPCLVPYDQLPESEKEYDRKLATETLKTIVALGYSVTKAKQS